MLTRRTPVLGITILAFAVCGLVAASAQGRKYKAPPPTSHIEVLVLKDTNQKPIPNAAVVFHSVRDGVDEGNLEVKTNEQGMAIIDVIPTGSNVDVQVIADGFATYAGTYMVAEPSRSIEIKMLKPRAQISTYVDTRGLPAQRPVGVQEPIVPTTPPPTQTLKSTAPGAPGGLNENPANKPKAAKPGVPVQTNPPNMHPDNQYPVDPAAAPKTVPPEA
jgi:hypothetical protein